MAWTERSTASSSSTTKMAIESVMALLPDKRQTHSKGCAPLQVGLGVDPAAVNLDDGLANAKAVSHAVSFGREKRVEQVDRRIRREPRAGILNFKHDRLGLGERTDRNRPSILLPILKRIAGVGQQIDDYLLELNPVTPHGRQLVGELKLDFDLVPAKLERHQVDRVVQQLADGAIGLGGGGAPRGGGGRGRGGG